jgi:hypothetical protein
MTGLPHNDPLWFRTNSNGGYERITREEMDAKLDMIIESWPKASQVATYSARVPQERESVGLKKTLSGNLTTRREPTKRWLSR